MTLKNQMTSDLPGFFNISEFAATITYTPSGGAPIFIAGILEEIDPSITTEAPPADSMVLHVETADVSSPQIGDTFTILGETWYLVENIGGGSHVGAWELLVTRSDKRRIG